MEYNKIKNAEELINNSRYLIKNPENYKNKWHDLFQNHNPIYYKGYIEFATPESNIAS